MSKRDRSPDIDLGTPSSKRTAGEDEAMDDTDLASEQLPPPSPNFAEEAKAKHLSSLWVRPNGLTFAAFVRNLSREMPSFASIDWVVETTNGFRVRTSFPKTVTQAAINLGWTLECPTAQDKTCDYTVRGIPTAAAIEDLQVDLAQHLQCQEDKIKIRRLHATTEDAVDRERPIPVVIVSIPESLAELLKSWKAFGIFSGKTAANPRKEAFIPQCQRCFAWNHRSGACKEKKKCSTCGETNHLRESCPKKDDPKRCFVCHGAHSVRYKGCPAKAMEEKRVRSAMKRPTVSHVAPSPPPPPPALPSLSFAEVLQKAGPSISASASAAAPRTAKPTSAEPIESSNRFAALLHMDVEGEHDHSDQHPSRAEKNRSRAMQISRERRKRDTLQIDLERVQSENSRRPNPMLKARIRTLRAHLRRSRGRLAALNSVRQQQDQQRQETRETIATQPWRQWVQMATSFVKPYLLKFGLPPTAVELLEGLALQLIDALQCM